MKKFRVIQQRNKCIGCGACKEVAAMRWQMSTADGKSTLIGATQKKGFYVTLIDETEINENVLAMKSCPVRIIQIIEV